VIVEEVPAELISERERQALHHVRNRANPYGVVDPRLMLKEEQKKGGVASMLSEGEVIAYSEKASNIWKQYQE
jgi:hypothetical protein